MGNPENEKTAPPQEQVFAPGQEQERFRFPPITDKTILLRNPQNGDIWLGFNPGRFAPRVVLAWAAFQIENVYQSLEDSIRQAQANMGQKPKKSLRDILTFY